MKNAADNPPIICTFLAAHVRGKQRRDAPPLVITKPVQVAPHSLLLCGTENQQPILTSTDLLGFSPSQSCMTVNSRGLILSRTSPRGAFQPQAVRRERQK